jgi:hypothetical protein
MRVECLRFRALRTALLGVTLLGSSACANVLGIEETTLAKEDSSTSAGPWDCVGNVEEAHTDAEELVLTVTTLGLDAMTPLPDLNVEVCRVSFGGSCQTKINGTTDEDGQLEIQVPVSPGGFEGYVEISGEVPNAEGTDTEPAQRLRWYYSRPRTKDFAITALMPAESLWATIAESIIGETPSEGRGYLSFEARDCDDAPAADVAVALKPRAESRLFYFAASTETFLAEDVQEATDVTGRGAFFEVTPGSLELTSRPTEVDELAARFTPTVEAKMISFVELAPNSF